MLINALSVRIVIPTACVAEQKQSRLISVFQRECRAKRIEVGVGIRRVQVDSPREAEEIPAEIIREITQVIILAGTTPEETTPVEIPEGEQEAGQPREEAELPVAAEVQEAPEVHRVPADLPAHLPAPAARGHHHARVVRHEHHHDHPVRYHQDRLRLREPLRDHHQQPPCDPPPLLR